MNVSLQQFRSLPSIEEIEAPKVVYHMTSKDNAASIIKDGKIKTGRDFICFFFPNKESILRYIKISKADAGRMFYDFDGRVHQAPPLDHANTVILELIPRGKETMAWYRENTTVGDNANPAVLGSMFDDCRICHYGDMRFYNNKDVRVIPLTEIDEQYKDDPVLKEIDALMNK